MLISKQVITLVLITIFCAGTFAEIENSQKIDINILINEPDPAKQKLVFADDYSPLLIIDSMYFVIVTLLTVGYGDINPSTSIGQVVGIFICLVTFIVIPTMLNNTLQLIESQSPYRSAIYNFQDAEYVIVTGFIGNTECEDFSSELFHDDHIQGSQHVHAVFI